MNTGLHMSISLANSPCNGRCSTSMAPFDERCQGCGRDIEEIRGIAVSTNIIRTLLELEWIKIVGHKESPGKPELFGTTPKFLDYFNKNKLSDLPEISDVESI